MKCPKCGSEDTKLVKRPKVYHCESCNHNWNQGFIDRAENEKTLKEGVDDVREV